ncbi:MAG: exodeoxyribonuclease VII large subunit, partial [Acidobacteriota bacterium]
EIKQSLEGFGILWIQGEISNFKHHSSGHMYFSLKDERAQIKAAFFRNSNRYVKFRPEDGLEVVVRGRISVYEPRGDYQAIVEYMEPVGLGSLQLAFEQLKKKLSQEGLFDPERKKSLPLLPDKVGIITSPTGAAVRDMLRVLERRNASLRILIYPARVQGAGAAEEIAAGISYLNTRPDIDVMIVGRGGGSIEDLWAFNEEVVARAIHASRIPIVSAVGHETDFTIADFVADLRAPTPSSAAELVSGAREDLVSTVRSLSRRALQAFRLGLEQSRARLQRLAGRPAFLVAPNKIRELQQRFDEAAFRMEDSLGRFLSGQRHRAEVIHTRLVRADLRRSVGICRQVLARRRQELLAGLLLSAHRRKARVELAMGRLHALSPLAILDRGYAICRDARGEILKSASRSRVGDGVAVRLARGELRCRIDQISMEDGNGTQGEGL